MSNTIHEIDFANQFYVSRIDLETFDFPKLRVTSWSNLFGGGGSYCIDPVEGSTYKGSLRTIEQNDDEPWMREHLQGLVDAWNEDPRQEWLQIIKKAAVYVNDYKQKQVAEFDKVVAEAEKSQALIEAVEKLQELEDAKTE